MKKTALAILMVTCLFTSCKDQKKEVVNENTKTEIKISDTLKWSERMALSIMKRFPKASDVDNHETLNWNYKHGLLALSFEKLYLETGNEKYFEYEKGYADDLIDSTGTILNYDIEKYNIDNINAGKTLFFLYEKTKDEKYLTAIKTLRKQLENHPRTKSGGLWHKKIYPYQMWLDGLYMGQPFYARYIAEFEDGKNFDDVAHQFEVCYKQTLDKKTGLLLHAWDESKQMQWADKTTGKSPNFWSRSLGWYVMALVDVLDYFPRDHSKRGMLIQQLNDLSTALMKVQDASGIWYQVPNFPEREGNYLESSGTAMFAYAFAKGVKKGYLPSDFNDVANKAFDGLVKELVKVDQDGKVHLTQTCKGAGLGGNPYRDASYEYYVSEAKKVNNLHGTGPFILAALELSR
ncbi:glycosyl hydrolase family 88 [Algibacter amylolyticus]|uniref:Glycosyl hydrolase family 88 n=1 Tax=Algibacter amylolyticus TaxID=1608400 RepID=A0A5M7BLA7_9FLAO|nr:glycoside hydrolase family 88 protein [Algibacter amylolyticus]KAA5827981.1 glycosyl hydrolase family 88 [Algibacter amylolyticus]MBB5267220.1 unsaturated rhamnogalacturonyl hydrolase [Algibacter amylolyticus]TSJ82226.1 glycosyl hydrolase family 88 [Algibacter amylolyticus]